MGARWGEFAAPLRTWLITALVCAASLVVMGGAEAWGAALTPVTGSPFAAGAEPSSVAFAPDGGLLAVSDSANSGSNSGAGPSVSMFTVNPVSGGLTSVPNSSPGTDPLALAFNPGGNFVALANSHGGVSVFSVDPTGAVTEVANSPFGAKLFPYSVAFSRDGALVATGDETGNTIGLFTVASDGTLTQVHGAPFKDGAEPDGVAFSPVADLLAVANSNNGTVAMFTIDPQTDSLVPAPGATFPAGPGTVSVAFSPSGGLLAAANAAGNSVSLFTVDSSTGALTPVLGSPFPAGASPVSVAFSPSGGLLATANDADSTLSLFSVSPVTEDLTPARGSPFTTPAAPQSVAFSPNGALLAVAAQTADDVSVFTVNASATSIAAPAGIPFTGIVATDQCAPAGASATIDWGDGTASSATADGAGNVSGTHTYAASGLYNGTVTVAGGCRTDTFTAAVSTQVATSTSATCLPSTVVVGQATICTATVTDSATTPSGSVRFSSSAGGAFATDGSCVLSGSGTAAACSVTYTATAGQLAVITASYPGDPAHLASSGSTSVAVGSPNPHGHALSSLVVRCLPGVVVVGQPTTCTATVSGTSDSGAPSGTVSFASSVGSSFAAEAVASGASCQLSGVGGADTSRCAATFTPTGASSGTITITARYTGDATHGAESAMSTAAFSPTAGITGAVHVLSGKVFVRIHNRGQLVQLPSSTVAIPIGSLIDARHGTVGLQTADDYLGPADSSRRLQTATISAGIFTIEQHTARLQRNHKGRATGIPATVLKLGNAAGAVRRAACRSTGAPTKGVVRSLTGVVKGLFRAQGRASTTTVTKGTWTVQDRCDGTLTRVRRGRATVSYRLHGRARIARLNAGQSILVRARFLAARRV